MTFADPPCSQGSCGPRDAGCGGDGGTAGARKRGNGLRESLLVRQGLGSPDPGAFGVCGASDVGLTGSAFSENVSVCACVAVVRVGSSDATPRMPMERLIFDTTLQCTRPLSVACCRRDIPRRNLITLTETWVRHLVVAAEDGCA